MKWGLKTLFEHHPSNANLIFTVILCEYLMVG